MKKKIDFFLEFPCFFYNPMDVGNLISHSSAFSKSSLYFWKFSVHILLKPHLENVSITLLACTAAAKSLQSCPTLCDPIGGSPPGSSVCGIFQARVLECGAIAFSRVMVYEVSKSWVRLSNTAHRRAQHMVLFEGYVLG